MVNCLGVVTTVGAPKFAIHNSLFTIRPWRNPAHSGLTSISPSIQRTSCISGKFLNIMLPGGNPQGPPPGWEPSGFGLMFLYFAVESYADRSGLQGANRGSLATRLSGPFSWRPGCKAKQQPLLYPADRVDHALRLNSSPSRRGRRENSITELRRKEFLREREGYSEMV